MLREEKMELKKDGLYWDKEDNPHCPACKTPLVTLMAMEDDPTVCFRCIKCSKDIPWREYGTPVKHIANNTPEPTPLPRRGSV
jgi:hypothetical protein